MKRALAIFATLLFGITAANAQVSPAAGWQATQIVRTNVASDGYRSYNYAWANGFYAGLLSSSSLAVPGLSYSYSIFYSYATGKETDVLLIMDDPHHAAASKGEVITDEHYILVPGTVSYRLYLTPWLSMGAYVGAEVSYCLSSKSYSTWPGVDGTNHWNVDHFDGTTNYNGYRRFDLGVLGGLGMVLFDHIRLEGGVSYGLLDRSAGDGLLHRCTVHAGIAYLFK